MSDSEERCANCHYYRVDDRGCHRLAPQPYSFFRYWEGELLRDIAWSLRILADIETPPDDADDEVNIEATEAMSIAGWPMVAVDNWCGEWRPCKSPAT